MSKRFKISLKRLGCLFGNHQYSAYPEAERKGKENRFAVYEMTNTCVYCGKKRKTKILIPEDM